QTVSLPKMGAKAVAAAVPCCLYRRCEFWEVTGRTPCHTAVATKLYQNVLIQGGLAGRARLPTAMDPQPLVRVLPNDAFQHALNSLSIGLHVSGYFDLRIKTQPIARLLFFPQSKTRNHGCAAMMCEFDKRRSGAGFLAKKIDKHTFGRRRV